MVWLPPGVILVMLGFVLLLPSQPTYTLPALSQATAKGPASPEAKRLFGLPALALNL